jgi:hypothetical protein
VPRLSELGVRAPREDRDWPAVGIVGRVHDQLIVDYRPEQILETFYAWPRSPALSFGASVNDKSWGRPDGEIGDCRAINALSRDHREYMRAWDPDR